METKVNQFKQAIANGQTQLGIWSCLSSPVAAEITANAGFDWILFDAEHSPVEIAGLFPLLQAAAAGATTPAVRPPWNDRVLIKRVLDIGPQTVLIPFVQSAEEAAEAVKSCHYPPEGMRGVAGATRASSFGRNKNYLKQANDQICILAQAETTTAISRLNAIAATPGIDGVFIGPSDLSASMGHLGDPTHPEVQAAIKAAVEPIKQAGKAPGILAKNADDAKRYLAWGYVFVACGVDAALLVNSCDTLLKDMRD